MKVLFFDTETNGLPINYKASYEDVNNWPRVIQLAWVLTDESGDIVNQSANLVQPNGWEVPKERFWIENGHSTERCAELGYPIENLLNDFLKACHAADVLAAHNLSFDHRIVWAEMIRAGIEPRRGMHKICTMLASTGYCAIPNTKGYGFKWPKLEELHFKLFERGFDGAHDALADVLATKDCFYELLERGIIQLPKQEEV
ncbi:MAG TPA: 3'-5' exonuclease [Chitinophagaceae bacterium]|nr:3'-5' exonuclease [Chitinophagaceae bacterium]